MGRSGVGGVVERDGGETVSADIATDASVPADGTDRSDGRLFTGFGALWYTRPPTAH
jgi:hypothetical protein